MAASRQLPQTEDGREPDEGLALTMQPPLQSSMMFPESPIPRPDRRVTIGGYSFGDGPDEDTTQLNSEVDRDQEAAEEDEVFRSMIDNADRVDGADGAGAAPDDTRARAPVILNEQVAEAEMTQGQTAIILQQFEKMTAMMQSLTQEKAQEKAERAEWERLLEHKINATIIASSGARGTPVAHGPVHPVHHPVHVQQSEAMTLSQSEQLTLAISHMATAIKTNSTKRGDAKTIISKVKNTKNARLTLMEWQLQLDAARVPRGSHACCKKWIRKATSMRGRRSTDAPTLARWKIAGTFIIGHGMNLRTHSGTGLSDYGRKSTRWSYSTTSLRSNVHRLARRRMSSNSYQI